MRKILGDGVIYLEEDERDVEIKRLKQALAELQEREKARDPRWKPKVDLSEKAQAPKTE